MTSNIGGELKSDGLGFQPTGREGETETALRKAFTPEFLGRLDKIICFKPLTDGAMEKIARKYLQEIEQRGKAVGMQLQFPDELVGMLKCGSGVKGGARYMRKLVQERVEEPLAVFLLQSGKRPTNVRGELTDGVLQFFG